MARRARPRVAANSKLPSSHRLRETGDRQFVAALARGLAILRCFRIGDHYLGNQELAKRAGLPKPTVSRLTYTLTRMNFLQHSPTREEYALGPGVLGLGHAYLAAQKVREVARPLMQELANFAQATVTLAENDGVRMVIVEICHGSPTYRLRVDIGERVPHNSTALGRAYLAALPPAQLDPFLESLGRELPADQSEKVTSEIKRSLREYDKHGFVFSCGDWSPETFAVGVPLISADRTHILGLSCSGPVFDMTRKRLTTEIGPRIVQLRDRIYESVQGFF
ncbi:MAG: IclR family transcriptional regulator [Candidatus Obscuribacterales bacterium]|nr:IclR family transcriptional regulator [Steroidobacteraceae bacterium]